ncbi:MAG: DNA starvation/stationary phase protection protein Dps [Planctomycetaceae bacterium]|nr:DNA starvation/stationary phase protection protein Dps [Planctomycetaceae bacterium]
MLHPTKIDISEEKRIALISVLQGTLTEAIDLKLQSKQAHWNVRGPHFIALHELFDQVAGIVEGFVDELAERMTTLGGVANGTIGYVAEQTNLPAYSVELVSGKDHVEALSGSIAAFGKLVRENIDKAAELGDADTEDLLTEVSRGIDQQLWFVEAHIHAES